MNPISYAAIAAAALLPLPAAAQHQHTPPAATPAPAPAPDPHAGHDMPPVPDHAQMDHSQMDHAAMPGMAHMVGMGSGTARLPDAEGPMRGVHFAAGDWKLMAHGYLWGAYTDQGGPRGDDMAFVQSMGMVMADRDLGGGANVQLRSMFSLEPLMGRPGYPNLFAAGETALGQALIDRQHPHDLFMELAARIDVPLGNDVTGFLYGGPVGEPALGPSAFMHRRSASYLTLAPVTHHWFDSTHINYGVVTAGAKSGGFQLEGSAFRGREPDEERWDIETSALDSWSVRASWSPTPNWTGQVSYGRLKSPEVLHPGEDEARTTASVHYASGTGLTATAAFSAKNRIPGETLTAWLIEANWDIDQHHSIFGRAENVANDELFPEDDPLHGRAFRVSKAEGGYAYRIPLTRDVELALGGSVAVYGKPDLLDATYGEAPVSGTVFAKLTLGR